GSSRMAVAAPVQKRKCATSNRAIPRAPLDERTMAPWPACPQNWAVSERSEADHVTPNAATAAHPPDVKRDETGPSDRKGRRRTVSPGPLSDPAPALAPNPRTPTGVRFASSRAQLLSHARPA